MSRGTKFLIVVATLVGLFIFWICMKPSPVEKEQPKFSNGEIVSTKLDGREGMIVDNMFKYNKKATCWSVKIRFGRGTSDETSTPENKTPENGLSITFGDIVSNLNVQTLNEFELEKK